MASSSPLLARTALVLSALYLLAVLGWTVVALGEPDAWAEMILLGAVGAALPGVPGLIVATLAVTNREPTRTAATTALVLVVLPLLGWLTLWVLSRS